jgi:hypothetical protein
MIWYEQIFIYITYLVYILYIIMAIGISNSTPKYLNELNYFRQIYIGVSLLLVFNPLKKHKGVRNFHRKIIFSACFFLLMPPFISIMRVLIDLQN